MPVVLWGRRYAGRGRWYKLGTFPDRDASFVESRARGESDEFEEFRHMPPGSLPALPEHCFIVEGA